jgi:hypothetical protein
VQGSTGPGYGYGWGTNSARLLLLIACCFTFTYPLGRQSCLEKESCLYINSFLVDVDDEEVLRMWKSTLFLLMRG